MIALKIPDLKQFTSKLFIQEAFDSFFMTEATIITYNTFIIDGHIQKEYYSEEELEEMGNPKLSLWRQVKPFCFSYIKGNRLPKAFRIVLQLPKEKLAEVLEDLPGFYNTESVGGLFLNIRYEKSDLYCITGLSHKTFTMDKSLEQAWDQYIRGLMRQLDIEIEEES